MDRSVLERRDEVGLFERSDLERREVKLGLFERPVFVRRDDCGLFDRPTTSFLRGAVGDFFGVAFLVTSLIVGDDVGEEEEEEEEEFNDRVAFASMLTVKSPVPEIGTLSSVMEKTEKQSPSISLYFCRRFFSIKSNELLLAVLLATLLLVPVPAPVP